MFKNQYLILILLISSCMNNPSTIHSDLDIQGHRGCRGDFPENTLQAFEHAINNHKVTTLEMDLSISKDHQIVLSHEPFFHHHITLHHGKEISESEEKSHNLYQMNYSEIKKYDVGLRPHPVFPDQKKIAAHKPLLRDVVQLADSLNPNILYNIEIKRKKSGDHVFHPSMKVFSELVIQEIERLGIKDRTYVQCFDIETLQYIHATNPSILLSLLVESQKEVKRSFEILGFYPDAYSPYFKLLTPQAVQYCHEHKIKVFPWTLNEPDDITSAINMGIDGIITDYPGRVNIIYQQLLKEKL